MTRPSGPQDRVAAIYVAFCELLTAHCLDVQTNTTAGEPLHLYRLREGVDLTLLEETERMVAAKLDRFRSLHSLLSELGDELDIPPTELGLLPDAKGRSGPSLGKELDRILDDALAFVVPASGC